MFGSTILEIATGLFFVFALTGAICTTLNELIESFLKKRARYLEDALREMLNDEKGTGIVKSFYEHPLICSLFTGAYSPSAGSRRGPSWGSNLPSYIPSRNFALAILDLVTPETSPKAAAEIQQSPLSIAAIRGNISTLKSLSLQRALLLALNTAGDDIDKARSELEKWFDSVMDRTSGWYKRASQQITFLIALVVVVACNINSLAIIDYLSHNPAERELLIARSSTYLQVQQKAAVDCSKENNADARAQCANKQNAKPLYAIPQADEELAKLNLPIGWNNEEHFWQLHNILTSLVGWLLTAIAASLGAPFWFDLLNKFMVIRSTVKPHEKSQEEASEDRQ